VITKADFYTLISVPAHRTKGVKYWCWSENT